MVKNKYAEREHCHPITILAFVLVFGLIVWNVINYNDKIEDLRERLNYFSNEGEWECIEKEQVTYRQCEELYKLRLEGLLDESPDYEICIDNWWGRDCPRGLFFEWDEYGDILDVQTDYNQNKCKDEMIYYGECIKWQKVKY